VAFFALPVLGSAMESSVVTHDGMMDGSGMPVEQYSPAEPWLNGSTIVVKELPGEVVSGVQPDGPTYAVPPGTTTYRVEVAGGDSRGSLQIIGAQGDTSVPETAMPFAVEVEMGEPGALQWVMAQGAYGQREVQCRVYVGEDLVAISTGQGMTECALPQP
jgi:hypothetical protein